MYSRCRRLAGGENRPRRNFNTYLVMIVPTYSYRSRTHVCRTTNLKLTRQAQAAYRNVFPLHCSPSVPSPRSRWLPTPQHLLLPLAMPQPAPDAPPTSRYRTLRYLVSPSPTPSPCRYLTLLAFLDHDVAPSRYPCFTPTPSPHRSSPFGHSCTSALASPVPPKSDAER